MRGKIAASIMCADIFNLENEIRVLEAMNIDYLHLDIMDGHYVKNITMGIGLVNELRKKSKIHRDIHLLVSNPTEVAKMINLYSNDIISFHYDAVDDVRECINYIKSTGAKVGLVLNPGTPIDILEPYLNDINMINLMMITPGFAGQPMEDGMISKISELKNYLEKHKSKKILIEVDGNVSFDHAVKMRRAGADIFVAGTSSVFTKGSKVEDNIKKLYEYIG